jgi:hypothetical protein
MRQVILSRFKSLLLLSLLFLGLCVSGYSQTAINLGEAVRFGVLSGEMVQLDYGVIVKKDAGSEAILDTNIVATGSKFGDGSCLVSQAVSDLDAAMLAAKNQTGTTISASLSTTTFTSGVYSVTGNAVINGTITLSGTSSDIFIFNFDSDVLILANTQIVLAGVDPEKVFFNISGKLEVQSGSSVCGTIMCEKKITALNSELKNASLLSKDTVIVFGGDSIGIDYKNLVLQPGDINLGLGSQFPF